MLYSVLLAGGRSSRMERDKSRLVHEGRTLLERALDLLAHTGADKVLISGQVDGFDSVPDLLPACGPLGGLHGTVHFIEQEYGLDGSLLLVIPVDMPMLNVDALARLVISIGDAGSCHYEGEIFPCVFRLTAQLRDHLDELFSESTELGGKRSMKALLAAFSERKVSRERLPENVFMNLNRPEDWAMFQQQMSSH